MLLSGHPDVRTAALWYHDWEAQQLTRTGTCPGINLRHLLWNRPEEAKAGANIFS